VLALAVSLALAFAAPAAGSTSAALPQRGVLQPGTSLGGVRLGDTPAVVRARWGSRYSLCGVCRLTTWLFTYRDGGPAGAPGSFRSGRVAAVFTLGTPLGWRTSKGVRLGDATRTAVDVYGPMRWSRCIGYGALSMRRTGVVTSIYTAGESIYGFALTRPAEPVCQ
jgi:hypothetical protein